MLHLVRTDRAVFLVHSSDPLCPRAGDGWVDVPGPVDGALTIKARAISATEFVECVAVAKLRARAIAKEHGIDPNTISTPATETQKVVTALEQLERASLFTLCARRAVVAVFGPEAMTSSLQHAPGAIVDMLPTVACSDLGNWAVNVSLSAPDPFVPGASE